MLRAICSLQRYAAVNKAAYALYTTAPSSTLNLFICATDVSSDRVAAALVAALKQQCAQGLNVYGVGGPSLQAQGLQCVVTDEQYAQLATAEVVPPVHSYITAKLPLPGVQAPSKTEHLKIFRDVIWEAALHGCSSRSKAPPQASAAAAAATSTQQQQQQPPPATSVIGVLPAEVTYDAVISVGSPLASQQLLFALRQAEKTKVARLPVIVQYMPPGLWNQQQVSSSAKTWSQLSDHVMCGLPFEPTVLHRSGAPASFVGHPILQALLQSGFSNYKKQIARLLQDKPGSAATPHSSSRISSPQSSLFKVGNASAFWQDYHRLVISPSSSSNSSDAPVDTSSSSSTTAAAVTSSRKRRAAAAAAAGSTQCNPLLLCLLPGSTESDICSSMPVFDLITKDLAQKHHDLAIAIIVPDILVEATREAVQNFSVPAVVAPEDFVLSDNALAAAAAAISHPGPVSLRAVAAGVPLVCVQEKLSLLSSLLSSLSRSKQLAFSCVPNLVSGYKAVPEFSLALGGDKRAAIEAVSELLTSGSASVGATHSGGSSSGSEWREQRAALQEVLLRLVPPINQQQQQQSSVSSSSRGGTRDWRAATGAAAGMLSPSECAAATLLELISLRKQQEDEQLRALLGSS